MFGLSRRTGPGRTTTCQTLLPIMWSPATPQLTTDFINQLIYGEMNACVSGGFRTPGVIFCSMEAADG